MEPNQNPQNQPVPPVGVQPMGEKRSIGPVVGIIVVIILLILGAFYFWGSKISSNAPAIQNENAVTTSSAPEASSDEVSTIEGELDAAGDLEIDLSDLDAIE